jgi:flagellar basal body-associated protein FliL
MAENQPPAGDRRGADLGPEARGKGNAGKSGSGKKLIMVGVVSALVVVETAFFFLMVPSGEEVAAMAEARLIERLAENDSPQASDGGGGGEHAKSIEVPLGADALVFNPLESDRPYRLDFRLFGTIQASHKERFESLMEQRKGRFRNRLILELRGCTLEELNEHQLGLIQRRILATTNQVLGEPIVETIGFEEYQVMED